MRSYTLQEKRSLFPTKQDQPKRGQPQGLPLQLPDSSGIGNGVQRRFIAELQSFDRSTA